MAFALGPLELRDVPVVYLEATRRLRAMRQVNARYVRPTSKSHGGTAKAGAYGVFSKVPPEERLVAEELDCWAHARAARELFFPERMPGSELGPVIIQAARRSACTASSSPSSSRPRTAPSFAS